MFLKFFISGVVVLYSALLFSFGVQVVDQQKDKELTLLLKSHVLVKGDYLSLNEIAQCQGLLDLCSEVMPLNMMKSPDPGKKSTLMKSEIVRILKEEFPLVRFSFLGHSTVSVQADYFVIDQKIIKSYVGSYVESLNKKFIDKNIKLKVSSFYHFQSYKFRNPQELSKIYSSLEVLDLKSLRKSSLEPIDVSIDLVSVSDLAKSFTIKAKINVAIYHYVYTSKRSIPKGRSLNKNNAEKIWVKSTRVSSGLIENISDLKNLVTRRSLSKKSVLYTDMFVRPIAIRRGDIVAIEVQNGGLTIQSKVKAINNGRVGDVIDVVYEGTKKFIQAKVVAHKTVVVKRR